MKPKSALQGSQGLRCRTETKRLGDRSGRSSLMFPFTVQDLELGEATLQKDYLNLYWISGTPEGELNLDDLWTAWGWRGGGGRGAVASTFVVETS